MTSKKVALPLDEVLQKLSESHSSELAKGTYLAGHACVDGCWLLSLCCWFRSDSLEAHLEVMVEVLGQWVRKVEIRGKVYIKRVDKMMNMKTLADIIKREQTELERV